MSLELRKRLLREKLMERRRELSFEEVWRLSRDIQRHFMAMPEFKEARNMALYSSFNNEALTDDILAQGIRLGKKVFFPKADSDKKGLLFFGVGKKTELQPGLYSISEPEASGDGADIRDMDCIVAPGVAFDRSGSRLGFGKGYYDRTLKGAACPVVALAYGFQVLDEVPVAAHDVKVHAIVTENGVIRCGGRPERGRLNI